MTRRIAILTTFEGDLPFTARHPDDGAKVAAALGAQRPDWRFDTWRVSDGHWPDDDSAYDGIVITGSPASVNDDKPWIRQLEGLVRERHARCVAMLGICFGHQAIASALGGRVANSPQGLRVGTVTTRIDRHPDWMQPPQDQFTLYAAHDEQVVVLPAGADRLGGATPSARTAATPSAGMCSRCSTTPSSATPSWSTCSTPSASSCRPRPWRWAGRRWPASRARPWTRRSCGSGSRSSSTNRSSPEPRLPGHSP